MNKTLILLIAIAFFSKIIGFFRDITLAYFYGTSFISDVYLIAFTVPLIIITLVSSGISDGFIPMYSKVKNSVGNKEALKYTNNVINLLLIVFTLIVIIGLLFTEYIVNIIAKGFVGEILELSIVFTRISILNVYFIGLSTIIGAFLRANNKPLVPSIIIFPFNLIIIIAIVISYYSDNLMLAFGHTLANAFQLFLLFYFALKTEFKYKIYFKPRDKQLKSMLLLSMPLFFGSSINELNKIIDRTIASDIVEGGVSALHFANTLNVFALGIFAFTITSLIFPKISKVAVENDFIKLKEYLTESVDVITYFLIPSTVAYMLFSEEIVTILFARGAFDVDAVKMTSESLFYYSISLLALGLKDLYTKVFYSLQDTKTPMINASISMLINIVLNIILSHYMGIPGLALATAISSIICTLLMSKTLRKRIDWNEKATFNNSLLKTIISSILMALVAVIVLEYLRIKLSLTLAFIFTILVAALAYFGVTLFLKVDTSLALYKYLRVGLKLKNGDK